MAQIQEINNNEKKEVVSNFLPNKRELFTNRHEEEIQFWLHPQDTDDANDGTFIALNNTPGIQFADAATKVSYFSFIWPRDLIFRKAEFIWSTPATTGNGRFQIDIGTGTDSTATNVRTTGGTAFTVAADGTANDLDFFNFTTTGGTNFSALRPQFRSLIGIKFTRTGADAGDTLTNTVNLYGIILTFAKPTEILR